MVSNAAVLALTASVDVDWRWQMSRPEVRTPRRRGCFCVDKDTHTYWSLRFCWKAFAEMNLSLHEVIVLGMWSKGNIKKKKPQNKITYSEKKNIFYGTMWCNQLCVASETWPTTAWCLFQLCNLFTIVSCNETLTDSSALCSLRDPSLWCSPGLLGSQCSWWIKHRMSVCVGGGCDFSLSLCGNTTVLSNNRKTRIMGRNQELQANLHHKTWRHSNIFPSTKRPG